MKFLNFKYNVMGLNMNLGNELLMTYDSFLSVHGISETKFKIQCIWFRSNFVT